MSKDKQRRFLIAGFSAVLMLAAPAVAGEAEFEPADIHEHGNPYFGEAKDIKGLSPVENARIKVQVKGTMRFFIVQTDLEGRSQKIGKSVGLKTHDIGTYSEGSCGKVHPLEAPVTCPWCSRTHG